MRFFVTDVHPIPAENFISTMLVLCDGMKEKGFDLSKIIKKRQTQ
jgi:hypothetical protein